MKIGKSLILSVFASLFFLVLVDSCDEMPWSRDKRIAIRTSSFTFWNGEEGRVSGFGWFGQYLLSFGGGAGGCCSSVEHINYKGRPKGEIVVRWQEIPKSHMMRFVYAYDPYPEIPIPPKEKYHTYYNIFYSFGKITQEAKKKEEIPLVYGKHPRYKQLYDRVKYQAGSRNTFYYKILSNGSWNFHPMDYWKVPLSEYGSIQGIEVSEIQYEYIMKNKYLDEKAPDLTPEQVQYIRARKKRGKVKESNH